MLMQNITTLEGVHQIGGMSEKKAGQNGHEAFDVEYQMPEKNTEPLRDHQGRLRSSEWLRACCARALVVPPEFFHIAGWVRMHPTDQSHAEACCSCLAMRYINTCDTEIAIAMQTWRSTMTTVTLLAKVVLCPKSVRICCA